MLGPVGRGAAVADHQRLGAVAPVVVLRAAAAGAARPRSSAPVSAGTAKRACMAHALPAAGQLLATRNREARLRDPDRGAAPAAYRTAGRASRARDGRRARPRSTTRQRRRLPPGALPRPRCQPALRLGDPRAVHEPVRVDRGAVRAPAHLDPPAGRPPRAGPRSAAVAARQPPAPTRTSARCTAAEPGATSAADAHRARRRGAIGLLRRPEAQRAPSRARQRAARSSIGSSSSAPARRTPRCSGPERQRLPGPQRAVAGRADADARARARPAARVRPRARDAAGRRTAARRRSATLSVQASGAAPSASTSGVMPAGSRDRVAERLALGAAPSRHGRRPHARVLDPPAEQRAARRRRAWPAARLPFVRRVALVCTPLSPRTRGVGPARRRSLGEPTGGPKAPGPTARTMRRPRSRCPRSRPPRRRRAARPRRGRTADRADAGRRRSRRPGSRSNSDQCRHRPADGDQHAPVAPPPRSRSRP